jgi:hypothetical protein
LHFGKIMRIQPWKNEDFAPQKKSLPDIFVVCDFYTLFAHID